MKKDKSLKEMKMLAADFSTLKNKLNKVWGGGNGGGNNGFSANFTPANLPANNPGFAAN